MYSRGGSLVESVTGRERDGRASRDHSLHSSFFDQPDILQRTVTHGPYARVPPLNGSKPRANH
jgi:hypothetical protein